MKLSELNSIYLPKTEMCELASKHGTDKSSHGYTKIYEKIMRDKKENANIFEIGIYLGNSINMWHSYFNSGIVCAIDNGRLVPNSNINVGSSNENPSDDEKKLLSGDILGVSDFSWLENDRIKCFIADQRSKSDLKKSFTHFGIEKFDFIIDDGHHYQEHQQVSLSFLFKNVNPGGYYIIEDVASNSNLLKGHFWGQKNEDLSDSTDSVFSEFLKSGILSSPYINEEDTYYIEQNIEDIFLYDSNNLNDSPISGSSKLLVIKKK